MAVLPLSSQLAAAECTGTPQAEMAAVSLTWSNHIPINVSLAMMLK